MNSAGLDPPATPPHDSDWEARFGRPIARSWFGRPTAEVARALLGCVLSRDDGHRVRAARIVETEAYLADDAASHAYRGPTRRNRSMFAGPGTLYMFRIHQVHCANVVTRRGEAVLLRAAEPITEGLGSMRGPGRLAREFELDLTYDGGDLTTGPVRILPRFGSRGTIAVGPRIGISKARELPLRFYVAGNRFVSGPRTARRDAT